MCVSRLIIVPDEGLDEEREIAEIEAYRKRGVVRWKRKGTKKAKSRD